MEATTRRMEADLPMLRAQRNIMAAIPLGVTAHISERYFVPSQWPEIAKGEWSWSGSTNVGSSIIPRLPMSKLLLNHHQKAPPTQHPTPTTHHPSPKGTGQEYDAHYRRMSRDFGLEPEEDLDKKRFKIKSSKPFK